MAIAMEETTDTHISGSQLWDTPDRVKGELPLNEQLRHQVAQHRMQMRSAQRGESTHLLVIVGPCSIHEEEAVLQYSRRLADLAATAQDELFVVMRFCIDKPRTISRPKDWAGRIMDPHLACNGTHDFNAGIRLARRLAIEVMQMGLPIAMEILDPDVVQYFDDILTVAWIGARSVQNPEHRRFASGASMSVGFKNPLNGDVAVAADAIESATHRNFFVGIDSKTGRKATFNSTGNRDVFLILRGSTDGPNFDSESVEAAVGLLMERKLPPFVVVDCSHGNSAKIHDRQVFVFEHVLAQRREGALVGLMLESYINPGSQEIPEDRSKLVPGTSITDACLSWQATESLLLTTAQSLRSRHAA